MSLSFDGQGKVNSGGNLGSGAQTLDCTISTSTDGDILIAVVDVFTNGTTSAVNGISGGGGLWTKRYASGHSATATHAGAYIHKEVWWSHQTTHGSNTVTTTFSGSDSVVYANVTVFAINGANTSSPWDSNGSLPATNVVSSSSGSTASVSGVSTTSATSALIVLVSDVDSGTTGPAFTADGGFTLFEANQNINFYLAQGSEGEILSSTESSATITAFGSQTVHDYIAYVDAIVPAASGPSGTWASTEAKDIFAASGTPGGPTGTWASTEAKDIFSGAGTAPISPPVYVNAGTGSSQSFGTSITLNLPASLVTGDLLIGFVFGGGNGSGWTWPVGWHQIDDIDITNWEGTYAYYYVTGSDTNPNITWTGNAAAIGGILHYTNTKRSSPIGAFQKNHNNGSTVTGGSLVTTGTQSLVVNVEYTASQTESAPTSYSAETNYNVGGTRFYAADAVEAVSGTTAPAISNGLSGAALWINFDFEILAYVPPPTGTWHSTEAKDTFAGIGGPVRGPLSVTEPKDTFAWSGIVPPPPLALDGHAIGGASGSGITSANVTLTTVTADDVIVLTAITGGFFNVGDITSVSDTAGLVWHKRQQRRFNSNQLSLNVWWAHAPTALAGDVITVTATATGFISLEAFGVSGANTTTPWDTHTGAGMFYDFVEVNPFGTYPVEVPIFTNAINTFTFGTWASGATTPSGVVQPASFTYLGDKSETEPVSGTVGTIANAYQVLNTQQVGASAFNLVEATGGEYAMHLDSIVGIGETGTADAIRWFFDGMGQRSIVVFAGGTTSNPMGLGTYHANSVLCCACLMSASGVLGEPTIASITDTNSNTWVRRSRVTNTTGTLALEVWYAQGSAVMDPTTGAITVQTANMGNGDVLGMVAWAVNGPSVFLRGEIWDGDPSLPATNFEDATATYETVGPFNTINQNVLVVSVASNIEPGGDLTGFNTPPYLFLHAPAELVSSTPSFNMAVEFKFSAAPVSSGTAEFDVSPRPPTWLMIADAMPVGPPSPPTGVWASLEIKDFFGNSGAFTRIGLGTAGWVGYVPAHAIMAATDSKDFTTNNGHFEPLFNSSGWIGFVPAHATMAVVDRKDTLAARAWVLGGPIVGRMAVIEDKDRFGWSNRATVTGTWASMEYRDRMGANAFLIPELPPFVVNVNKRRLMIIT